MPITTGKIGFIAIKTSLHIAKKPKIKNKLIYKKRKSYFTKYRKKHKEVFRLASSKYYKKNKEKIKAKAKRYYKKNKDEILEKNKIYKQKNKEAIKIQIALYYQKNKRAFHKKYLTNKVDKIYQNIPIYRAIKQWKKAK